METSEIGSKQAVVENSRIWKNQKGLNLGLLLCCIELYLTTFTQEQNNNRTFPTSSHSCYSISDPNSRFSRVIHEPFQSFSLSLHPLLPFQVRQFLIPGIAVPAVSTREQRRVIEPHPCPAPTAISFRAPLEPKHTYLGSLLNASLARRFERD